MEAIFPRRRVRRTGKEFLDGQDASIFRLLMPKFLVTLGLILVALGLAWPLARRLGLGRLPGDILIKGEHATFYFPLVTCLLVSAVLSLLFWFFGR